jgi:xanthine dehydrogenase accessory factor
MNTLSLWNTIIEHLESGSALILYVVAASEKGSPGNAGFAMVVMLEGSVHAVVGTIGGGVMERNLVAEAQTSLREGIGTHWLRKLHHYKRDGFEPSGLICSGSQTIAACTLTKNDLPTLYHLRNAVAENTPLMMQLSPKGISLRAADSIANSTTTRFRLVNESATQWLYEELLGAPDTVVIAGGGHVGLALSRQMALLGLYVIISDDRDHLETMAQNVFAHKKLVQPFEQLGDLVQQQLCARRRTFVVVVTTAYKSDVATLCSLARNSTQPEYIGLMGSAAKIKTIMREAEEAGVSREWLNSVHAPIGVEINSDTPEEIAVSIAAEIIRVKNAR